MYLDTDAILAIIKSADWLKADVERKLREHESKLATSTFTVIEAEIVLGRDYNRALCVGVYDKLKERDIKFLPFTEDVLKESIKLLKNYPKLNVFDSVHVAFCIQNNESIMSTDKLFDRIKEIKRIDPRS